MANKKATSEARSKGKGKKTTGVPPPKKAKGNNNSSITTDQGQGSRPKHQSPADHPLFGVRRYVHKKHNTSDPVLHVNVTDHLSYKVDFVNYCEVL
jgi:ribosome assembly protein YihI (activator of Der GTPase)